ncbi:uncharacterized protein [Procambarus clarkii]|uniref:uncharacterized protein n=1 Tax=Procambarus clarkii TaxID=6728 RepID=UPI003743130D
MSWLKDPVFEKWLAEVKEDGNKAYCKVCRTEIRAHRSGLKKHSETLKHRQNISEIVNYTGGKFIVCPDKLQTLKNFFSTAYKTEERVLKDNIGRNVIPTDTNQKIQVTMYYKNKKTASLLMKNSPDTNQNALKEANVVYAFTYPLGDYQP